MAGRKFDFIAPGVRVREIDNTARQRTGEGVGPTLIVRSERGPGMKPIQVQSFSEYIDIFGYPFPGGAVDDGWRDQNKSAPSYGGYAAQAWLLNSSPCNVVRLLGIEHQDATTAGKAGWETKDSAGSANGLGSTNADGGAYGLFICDSASAGTPVTGTLAAVFYITEGSIALSGTLRGTTDVPTTGSAVFVKSVGADREFKAIVYDKNGAVVKETAFNFNQSSSRFIRKVFNTNPTLTNAAITNSDQLVNYWVGQTYERTLDDVLASSSAGTNYAVLLGLRGDSASKEGSDFRYPSQAAQTGWYFAQDLQVVSGNVNSYDPNNMTKLFRFHGINNGEWESRNLKISIEDLKAPTETNKFGTFTVTVRMADDSDNAPKIVERFTNCNLNSNSPNYLAEKIGDVYHTWDSGENVYVQRGSRANRSRFIRVEMAEVVESNAVPSETLPFGVYGPVRHKGFSIFSGSTDFKVYGASLAEAPSFSDAHAQGGTLPICRARQTQVAVDVGAVQMTASFKFPAPSLRADSTEGNLSSPKQAYFGLTTSKEGSNRFDASYRDVVYPLPRSYDTFAPGTSTEYAWVFSLDDLSGSGTNHAAYSSGSRAAGTSLTAVYGDYKEVLDRGFNKFTAPLFGGFDGLDITEKDPFRNTLLDDKTEETSYAYASVKRAMDAIRHAEDVETKILCMPGLTNEGLTNHLMNVADERQDCVAIIDLPGTYIPSHENTNPESSRLGSIDTLISQKNSRGLSTSRAAAYHPWLLCRDDQTNKAFWAPPSIGGLQAIAYTEANAGIFIAPAGTDRGGLSKIPGVKIVDVREKLRQKDMNKLAQAKINSIAKFPGSGIAVWDQITFYEEESALTQLDIRFLSDYLKRELEKMALDVVFEKNVKKTWNTFKTRADKLLENVRSRQGIVWYDFQLDESTTTPDLIDRNIMYAKLFILPAQSIRHIEIELNLRGAVG